MSPTTDPTRIKAVLLVGGAQKGTRFRPLSLQLPKPLFPIAGVPLIEHHIKQLCKLDGITEIFLLGSFPAAEFDEFIAECARKYPSPPIIHYLQEEGSLGTAGGLLRFQSNILAGNPNIILVLNADICGDLPIPDLIDELSKHKEAECVLLTTEATREQSINFGSVVIDRKDIETGRVGGRVLHYVDRPSSFVSTHISCGLYVLRPSTWNLLEKAAAQKWLDYRGAGAGAGEMCTTRYQSLWLETDIFPTMASNGSLYAFHTTKWWSQTKTPGAVLYANRHYLRLYREHEPQRLRTNGQPCEIVGDVYIDASAEIHPTAKIGPNVSIGARVRVGPGVRIRESIILQDVVLEKHCCILHSVIGWRSSVGPWARVEGSPIEPNPNVPFAKLENRSLFNSDGRINPSLSILGSEVNVLREAMILNSVVLPYKELNASYRNQIIL